MTALVYRNPAGWQIRHEIKTLQRCRLGPVLLTACLCCMPRDGIKQLNFLLFVAIVFLLHRSKTIRNFSY